MSSSLMRLAALAVLFVMCATLVTGIPQLFVQEEPEQQEPVDDEPLTRTRRDSSPSGGHHHDSHGGFGGGGGGGGGGGHHGWGWPEKQKGWGGWPSVGPVFTYVRTDGWSNFQWGVRHKVGGNKGWHGK